MASFRVINPSTKEVVLETDDWVEACERALSRNCRSGETLTVRGVHPSHAWGEDVVGERFRIPRCTTCGAWGNGSYGSQAPCGYDFGGRSLVSTIDRELALRAGAPEANLGLEGVPIGLDCTNCGKPITAAYIAHGSDPAVLVSDMMQDLVKAAVRAVIDRGDHPQLCRACAPPPTETPMQRRVRRLRNEA